MPPKPEKNKNGDKTADDIIATCMEQIKKFLAAEFAKHNTHSSWRLNRTHH